MRGQALRHRFWRGVEEVTLYHRHYSSSAWDPAIPHDKAHIVKCHQQWAALGEHAFSSRDIPTLVSANPQRWSQFIGPKNILFCDCRRCKLKPLYTGNNFQWEVLYNLPLGPNSMGSGTVHGWGVEQLPTCNLVVAVKFLWSRKQICFQLFHHTAGPPRPPLKRLQQTTCDLVSTRVSKG